jgi:predicted nucleic acid-binding OB-fold protein
MISFSLVDVKNITSDIPRSSFPEADLDRLAELILESEGIIRPLVLKVTGAESYTVVDGHFEYYAAVRAREKDPRKGEMVNAFVISPKSEITIAKQAELLRAVESLDKIKPLSDTTNLEARLASIELRFEKQINELRSEQAQARQRVEDKLKQIESQSSKQIAPLEAFNTLSPFELVLRLKTAGLTGKKADKIIQNIKSQRQKKKFESLSDVVTRVEGLSDKGMVTLIDSWLQISFK